MLQKQQPRATNLEYGPLLPVHEDCGTYTRATLHDNNLVVITPSLDMCLWMEAITFGDDHFHNEQQLKLRGVDADISGYNITTGVLVSAFHAFLGTEKTTRASWDVVHRRISNFSFPPG